MDYAVIKSGGRQFKVSLGDTIEIDRLSNLKPNDKIEFADVLLLVSDKNISLGRPTLKEGAKVTGTVVGHIRGEKIRVAKFKAKVRYRRVTGHRQALTRVKIEKIVLTSVKN